MRDIARRATMLAGDRSQGVGETKPRRSQGAISPASIVMSLVISRIACIGTYSILCASAAETRFSVTAESKAMLYIPLQRNTM